MKLFTAMPWHNKVSVYIHPTPHLDSCSLAYIFLSKESMRIRRLRCHLAIDVLGSMEGTILHKRARIPNRMGAKGYGGGYSGCQKWRQFKIDENASLSTLRYAEMLGIGKDELPKLTPRLYLSAVEIREGKRHWPVGTKIARKSSLVQGEGLKKSAGL